MFEDVDNLLTISDCSRGGSDTKTARQKHVEKISVENDVCSRTNLENWVLSRKQLARK